MIRNEADFAPDMLDAFSHEIETMRRSGSWEKGDLISLFEQTVPEFHHLETGKYLEARM